MCGKNIEFLKKKRICRSCVEEDYLRNKINELGQQQACSYCGFSDQTWSLAELAVRVETAFEQHYARTSDKPNVYQYGLMAVQESGYKWKRAGDPIVCAIMGAAGIPVNAAEDILKVLDSKHCDFEIAKKGVETEFSQGSQYEQKRIDADAWHHDWNSFETSLKSESRFFSRDAAKLLDAVFDGIDNLRTRDNRPLVIDAGPGTGLSAVFRARVFQGEEQLKEAMCRPDIHLGPPPAKLAAAGRMNAQGISIFYGATDERVAIAEVRPPVDSRIAIARFEIIRPLRLIDLAAVTNIETNGSIFDTELAGRMEHASFMQSLCRRITRPVMPNDEALEYVVTQTIADFLAAKSPVSIDGIVYPSAQAATGQNIALFHKASRVEPMDVPEGTEIVAYLGYIEIDGSEGAYAVLEEVPPTLDDANGSDADVSERPLSIREIARSYSQVRNEMPTDQRKPSLHIAPKSVCVHRVLHVAVKTEEFQVARHRLD